METVRSSKIDKSAARLWYHWHEPGTSTEEKNLIRKLDFFILTYTCLTFFVKYLDQTNVTNAFLSGMKEDLGLYGNELNWLTTYFNIGVIIGAPVSTAMLTIVHPRYWLPACTAIWSIFVLSMFKAQNAQTLYGLRFACGLFESGAYPGSLYIIGTWYQTSEISRRTGIFLFSSVFGSMCSGYIQSGLLRHMHNRFGIASWRWLFIFDCILGVPVGVFGFLNCPDEPKGRRPWWMTESEQQLSIERMANDGRDSHGKWNLSCVRRIFTSWQLYTFTVAWCLVELTCGNNIARWMGLWLKSLKSPDGTPQYSKEQYNDLPTVVGIMQLVWIAISSVAADALKNRAIPFFVLAVVLLLCYVGLLVGTANHSLHFALYYLGSAYGGLSPLLASWISSCCGGDKQLRVFITAFMISAGYAVESPVQQVVFPVSDAPWFRKSHGYRYGVAIVAATIVWCTVIAPIIELYACGRRDKSNDAVQEPGRGQ